MKNIRVLDSEDLPTNTSSNEHFQDVVERARGRRGFLKSGLGLSAAMFLAGPLAACGGSSGNGGGEGAEAPPGSSLLGFKAIPISTEDTIMVAEGYTATPFVPWGTPLFAGDPEWKND